MDGPGMDVPEMDVPGMDVPGMDVPAGVRRAGVAGQGAGPFPVPTVHQALSAVCRVCSGAPVCGDSNSNNINAGFGRSLGSVCSLRAGWISRALGSHSGLAGLGAVHQRHEWDCWGDRARAGRRALPALPGLGGVTQTRCKAVSLWFSVIDSL